MRYRLNTLLIFVAAVPPLLFLMSCFVVWLLFRPNFHFGVRSYGIYAEIIGMSFSAALITAGRHAIKTRQMPVRGGGLITGDKAVESGRGAVAVGTLVLIGWAVALIISLI